MRTALLTAGLLFLTLGTARADAPSWPDLSEVPEGLSGGEHDAAVIVGVENYTYLPDVPGAAQNALDWYRFLSARGVPSHKIRLLVDPIRDSDGRMPSDDPKATNDGILSAVAQASAEVEEGGTLWFIFIGHGAPGQDGTDGMLVGVDASGTARGIYSRSVSRSKVLSTLAEGAQAETVALLDTCFSGRTPGGDALVSDLQPVIPVGLSVTTAATVLTATSSNQFAGPLPPGGRPAFSYLTLGALHGWGDLDRDGNVTASEAVTYSRNTLMSLVTDRQQEPQLEGGNGDLVLSTGNRPGPDIDAMRLAMISGGMQGSSQVNPNNPLGTFVMDMDVTAMLAEQQCERAAADLAAAEQRDALATAQQTDREQILEQWGTLSEQAAACGQLDDEPTRRRCHEQVEAFAEVLEGRTVDIPARVVSVETECGDRQSAAEGFTEPSQAAVDVLMQVEGLLGQYSEDHRLGGGTTVATPGAGGLPSGRAPQVTESLRSGFSGDPRSYDLRVGGSLEETVRTSELGLASGCGGFVATDAPAMVLDYRAGRSPLRIAACSTADTTLLVRGPDGWYCNDDAVGTNPEVRLDTPRTGEYEIFLGNVVPQDATATLHLSELASRQLCEGAPTPSPAPAPTPSARTTLDHTATPRYGRAALSAGFSGDPRWVAAQAGASREGATSAADLGLATGCRGVVDATKPDYQIDYTPGSYTLRTGFCSDADTSLVVRSPSGRWSCDDDSGSGTNPDLRLERPERGLYSVWIGSIDGSPHRGNLWVSERNSGDPCRSAPDAESSTPSVVTTPSTGGRPNYSGTPRYGSMGLRSGFTNDPVTVPVRAGGSSDVRQMNLDPSCRGFIAPSQPDYRVNFEAGRYTFRIAACSDEDTTLVISDGQGNWRCSDDAEGRNPVVMWNDAPSGAYDVWVGRYSSGEGPATLVFSENSGPYCD